MAWLQWNLWDGILALYIPQCFSAHVLSPLLSHPTDRRSFGVHRWLHAQLPLGTAAAEYEDKAGNGWSHVHIPSQVSNRASHRWDKSESNNGGGCSLDCWTLLVLLLRYVKHYCAFWYEGTWKYLIPAKNSLFLNPFSWCSLLFLILKKIEFEVSP